MNLLFIFGAGTEKPDVTMETKHRVYRELDDEVKQKISLSSRNKPKSEIHKQHISQGMIDYWQTVPHRPDNDDTATDEIV